MNYRRDHRSSRASLFNDLEEGSLRASSSYSDDINEHGNDKAVETLQDRVIFLKQADFILERIKANQHGAGYCQLPICLESCPQNMFNSSNYGASYVKDWNSARTDTEFLTGDIHDEVESHNRFLDRMGNHMDASRGIMSGTMDRFRMVFEKKSSRRMCTLVTCFVVSFLVIYYLVRILRYFKYG